MADERRVEGLDLGYGPPAIELGIATTRPSRTKIVVDADPEARTLRKVIDPTTGEILADHLTPQQAKAHIKGLPKAQRQIAIVQAASPLPRRPASLEPPGRGDPPDTGPPIPMRWEHDLLKGTRQVPDYGGRHSD